jgi:glycosyltransferase involved in cell wall biosynthesis
LAEAAAGLVARGHEVAVVVPRLRPEDPPSERVDGIDLRRFTAGRGPARLFGPMGAIKELLAEKGGFDAVHSHHAFFGAVPLWHPSLAGIRHVCQFQGPWAGESKVEGLNHQAKYWIERAAYARCDRFIVLSQGFKSLLSRDYAVEPSKIVVVPAAVELGRFRPRDRAEVRRELGWPAGPIVFVMRRLVRRMGLEVLIDAFVDVPGARLVVGGTGPLEGELKAQVARLGLQDRVSFPGRLADDDLVRHYQAADLTVVPTIALEGFGLVTVESLACGTPVVGTAEGGTQEILEGFRPDLLVPPGDAAALARKIREALAAPPSQEACRAYAEAHYAWPRVLDHLEAELSGGR